MDRNNQTPDTDLESRPGHTSEPFKPGKEKRPRKGTATPPSELRHPEDFGRRRDIETADEPAEEHDRRHHDQDAEVGRPI